MEILNVARARSIWLMDLGDLNPRGKYLVPLLLEWLKGAYSFLKIPTSSDDFEADTKALAFLHGSFRDKNNYPIEVDLRLYNDGLIADTRSSTEETDLFLEDVLRSGSREFNLAYEPSVVRMKLYASEINFRCGHPLNALNPKLGKICQKLASLARTNPPSASFELSSVAFWPEPIQANGGPSFRIERKLSTSFSENRYYSSAPLKTQEHVGLLKDIESVLSQPTPA